MNITTDAPELDKRNPDMMWIELESESGQLARIRLTPPYAAGLFGPAAEITKALVEILGEVKAAFRFLDELERNCGEYIAECHGEIPYGKWVVINLSRRTLQIRYAPIDRDISFVLIGSE